MTQSSDGDVDASMEAAAAVHRGGALRPPAARVALLRGAAEELEQRAADLIAAADQESHLGPARLRNELTRTTTQLEAFAAIVADGSWARATIDTAAPGLRRMMWPIGPVVVFGASNFPFAFATPGGDTASALAAACPVVVKAHPAHPTTAAIAADAIARAVERAGLPAACFQQVAGDVAVGVALVEQPATRAVAFTGSFAAGRALFDAAARRVEPIPVYAEMGSTNPVFVLPGALGERAESVVSALADSVVLGAGQFCTNPGVIVTIDGDGFARALADALSARAPAPMLTPGIAGRYRDDVAWMLEADGVDVLTGTPEEGRPACVLVDAASYRNTPELRREVFGPLTVVVSCADAAELVALGGEVDGQLTCSVFAADDDAALVDALVGVLPEHCGRLVWNAVPTGVTVSPAMQHGGPYPASTDSRSTSVGTAAIERFLRPVTFQGFPDALLPPELRDANPLDIVRRVDGVYTSAAVAGAG